MRILSLYLVIGLVLLVFGFVATGPCPNKNDDALNDAVFVLTWPVGLYGYVIAGDQSVDAWLHTQACAGGLGPYRAQRSLDGPGDRPAAPPADRPWSSSPYSGPAPSRS